MHSNLFNWIVPSKLIYYLASIQISRCVFAHRIKVVNESLLNYFTVELGIDRHFEALRQFLLMQDGEFGQTLCDQLSEKVTLNQSRLFLVVTYFLAFLKTFHIVLKSKPIFLLNTAAKLN